MTVNDFEYNSSGSKIRLDRSLREIERNSGKGCSMRSDNFVHQSQYFLGKFEQIEWHHDFKTNPNSGKFKTSWGMVSAAVEQTFRFQNVGQRELLIQLFHGGCDGQSLRDKGMRIRSMSTAHGEIRGLRSADFGAMMPAEVFQGASELGETF
jgi:hypothetical protein